MGNYQTDGVNSYQMFSDFRLTEENGLLVLKAKFNMEFGSGNGSELTISIKVVDENLAIVWGYTRFNGQAVQFRKGSDGSEKMLFTGFQGELKT
jgi:hypothetical protein